MFAIQAWPNWGVIKKFAKNIKATSKLAIPFSIPCRHLRPHPNLRGHLHPAAAAYIREELLRSIRAAIWHVLNTSKATIIQDTSVISSTSASLVQSPGSLLRYGYLYYRLAFAGPLSARFRQSDHFWIAVNFLSKPFPLQYAQCCVRWIKRQAGCK